MFINCSKRLPFSLILCWVLTPDWGLHHCERHDPRGVCWPGRYRSVLCQCPEHPAPHPGKLSLSCHASCHSCHPDQDPGDAPGHRVSHPRLSQCALFGLRLFTILWDSWQGWIFHKKLDKKIPKGWEILTILVPRSLKHDHKYSCKIFTPYSRSDWRGEWRGVPPRGQAERSHQINPVKKV